MTRSATDPAAQTLPEILPIFPLAGVLLLPRGHLPLHIFEPRYRSMTEAVLGGDRMIGMVQPRQAPDEPVGDRANLYKTGCAGRIVSFSETEDGRFYIALRGVCRFRIAEELPMIDGYRRVRPDFSAFGSDLAWADVSGLDRTRLYAAVRAYLSISNLEADWSAVEKASDEALVTALAMTCPFGPLEKQALLECVDFTGRAEMLISLLEMAICGMESSSPGTAH